MSSKTMKKAGMSTKKMKINVKKKAPWASSSASDSGMEQIFTPQNSLEEDIVTVGDEILKDGSLETS
jgi:hypothetical protein